MDYIGSKLKLNDWIFDILSQYIPEKEWKNLWFMDGCSGSGSTSKYAIKKGFKVISNDLFQFSSTIVKGFSGIDIRRDNKARILIDKHINKINSINGIKDFFYNNYSVSAGRPYFIDENAMRIDATRNYIEEITDEKIKNYLLYISLESLSSVLNTTGVQAAFLKKIKKRANNYFTVKLYPTYNGEVKTYSKNLKEIVSLPCDILYVDPPYNNRQYGPNYHLYETFVKWDYPSLQGVSGLRDWKSESKSDFCTKKTCIDIFNKIVKDTSAKIVLISYSSDGLLSEEEMCDIIEPFGQIDVYKKNQNRYKADISKDRKYNIADLQEFLFVLNKNNS